MDGIEQMMLDHQDGADPNQGFNSNNQNSRSKAQTQ